MSQANRPDTTIPSRRALLAGAPAVAAAALAGGTVTNALAIAVVKAAEVDPIFAAITRERNAYAEYCRTSAIQDEIAERHPGEAHRGTRTKAHRAWWAALQQAENEHRGNIAGWYDAQVDFLTTQATTVAGLLAFINHVDNYCDPDKGWDDEWGNDAFPTLAAAVRSILGGGARS